MQKFAFFIFIIPLFAFGQSKYQVNDVPVLRHGNAMQNPWLGGLNNPVFSPMDINRDSLQDLFVYDKAGWKALAFINTGSTGHPLFTYHPEYDYMFPADLADWAVMRDYNRDGIADMLAVNVAGMRAYLGYRIGDFLGYTLSYQDLSYTAGAFKDSIWTFKDNMPVMMDVDGDGDLDILAPDISGGVTLDYYKNIAVDSGYSPDSLVFTLGTSCRDQAWGAFFEDVLDCGVQLGQCKKELPAGNPGGGGIEARHQGGACCGFHYRNNHVTSLLLSDVYCNTTKFLDNTGDTILSNVTAYDTIFPAYDVPVNLPLFPCAYEVDADNDGNKDLFFSPFASNANQEGQSQDVNVVQYYHNDGIDSVSRYHYMGDTMLMNGVIDVGTESHPVFTDYNHDGLIDIVSGNYGRFEPSGFPMSSLALYTNTGSDTLPVYTETSLNWGNLSTYNLNGVYPAFGDLNGDGKPDMVVGDASGNIHFFSNAGSATDSFPSMTGPYWFGINVGANAAPFIYDVNGDSLNDLVIGSRNNNVYYFPNTGTRTHPVFSPSVVNPNFGNIKVYNLAALGTPPGYASPWIKVENGATFIYSGSQLGHTYKYLVNPDSLMSGSFALLSSDYLGVNPGQRSTISVADINHDGVNDYLTGNIRGGFNLFSDVNWGHLPQISAIGETQQPAAELELFPNPARNLLNCRLTGGAERPVSATLFDLLGRPAPATESTTGPNGLSIRLSNLPDGVYVVVVKDHEGHLYQKKILIFN